MVSVMACSAWFVQAAHVWHLSGQQAMWHESGRQEVLGQEQGTCARNLQGELGSMARGMQGWGPASCTW